MTNRKLVIFLSAAAIFFVLTIVIGPYYRFLKYTLKISPLRTIFSKNGIKKIDNEVNFLLLGIAGADHEGPNLSDSISVLSYDFETNKLTSIGIPRDIWSDTLKDKINSAYAYGEAKADDGGLKLAKAEIGAVAGFPIQYAAVIDFEKFDELIDFLGGVEIEVGRSFTDKKFPIPGKENDSCDGDEEFGCRYETVRFKKGKTLMNGKTALKFVRSRNAEGPEGSDFARSERQQLVFEAVKNKSVKIIKSLNLKKISAFYKKADSLISRDFSNQQAAIIIKNVVFKKNFLQKSYSLKQDLFEIPDPSVYGRYVLIPKKDYPAVHNYIRCLIEKELQKDCESLIDKGKENN